MKIDNYNIKKFFELSLAGYSYNTNFYFCFGEKEKIKPKFILDIVMKIEILSSCFYFKAVSFYHQRLSASILRKNIQSIKKNEFYSHKSVERIFNFEIPKLEYRANCPNFLIYIIYFKNSTIVVFQIIHSVFDSESINIL